MRIRPLVGIADIDIRYKSRICVTAASAHRRDFIRFAYFLEIIIKFLLSQNTLLPSNLVETADDTHID